MRLRLLLLAAPLLLGACASFPPSVGASRQTPSSGGSAGAMGPGYCQTIPEVSQRNQWMNLCFRD